MAIASPDDAASESSTSERHGVTVALLAAVYTVHMLDRQILGILIPPIKAELGLSDTALGVLSGLAFTVFFSTVGLAVGRLADRLDRARIITFSVALFSAMTAACGLATGFWQLLLARIGVGVGEGGTNPASHSIIADLYPPQGRASAMAAYASGQHLGLLLAFGLGGWLAQTVGWRATFVVVGAIGLVLAAVLKLALRDPRHARGPAAVVPELPPMEVARSVLRSRVLRHLFMAGALATGAALGLLTWLPALLTRVHGLTLAQAGVLLAVVFGLAGGLGTYLFGRMVDAAGRGDARRKPRLLAACQLVLAALWAAALLVSDPGAALMLLIVACVPLGAFFGGTVAMVQDAVDPRARAFSSALLLLFANLLGASLGPLVVGVLSDALAHSAGVHALRLALLAMPVMLAWSALHFALLQRRT